VTAGNADVAFYCRRQHLNIEFILVRYNVLYHLCMHRQNDSNQSQTFTFTYRCKASYIKTDH